MAAAPLSTVAPPLYSVGARIKCNAHPNLHVTLAYVGECNEKRLFSLQQAIKVRSDKPIRLVLGELDLFGPKKDIPVIRCKFAREDVANLWQSFYDAHGQTPTGWTDTKPAVWNYHVTLKKPGVREELSTKKEIVCTGLFIEQIGPGYEPIFCVPLPDA